MNLQRILKILACVLVILSAAVVWIVPPGLVPTILQENVVKWTIMVCLIVFAVLLDQKGQKGRILGVLQYGAIFIILFGALGASITAVPTEIEVPLHEPMSLEACGLEDCFLQVDAVEGATIETAEIALVYTREDNIAFHETVSQANPLNIDFVEIHPLGLTDQQVTFSVQENIWRYVVLFGEGLFVFSLFLSMLQLLLKSLLRKRGGKKC